MGRGGDLYTADLSDAFAVPFFRHRELLIDLNNRFHRLFKIFPPEYAILSAVRKI